MSDQTVTIEIPIDELDAYIAGIDQAIDDARIMHHDRCCGSQELRDAADSIEYAYKMLDVLERLRGD